MHGAAHFFLEMQTWNQRQPYPAECTYLLIGAFLLLALNLYWGNLVPGVLDILQLVDLSIFDM